MRQSSQTGHWLDGFERVAPEMLGRHVRRAQRLQVKAGLDVAQGARRVITGQGRVPVAPEGVDERVATQLTAIRSSAELLRDAPDMSARDRARVLDVVLDAEARLEDVLAELRRRRVQGA